MHHIPNIISLSRIVLVLPVVYFIWINEWKTAFALMFIAGVSDGVDGYLARRFNWQSKLGATLDPLADKLLIVSIFIVLGVKGVVPQWLVLVIVIRDLVIVSGLMVYRFATKELKMGSLFISKVNTALLIVLVLLHMFNLSVAPVSETIINSLTLLIVITTVVSGALYVILWTKYFVSHNESIEEK